MEFEWDDTKAENNFTKHQVRFEVAVKVFFDENRLVTIDDRVAYGEERRIVFGNIDGRLYVVVYTERPPVIRIISARKANKREQRKYG